MAAVSMLVPSLQYIRLQQLTHVEDTLRTNIELKTLLQFFLHTIFYSTNYYIGPIHIMEHLHQVRLMSYLN